MSDNENVGDPRPHLSTRPSKYRRVSESKEEIKEADSITFSEWKTCRRLTYKEFCDWFSQKCRDAADTESDADLTDDLEEFSDVDSEDAAEPAASPAEPAEPVKSGTISSMWPTSLCKPRRTVRLLLEDSPSSSTTSKAMQL